MLLSSSNTLPKKLLAMISTREMQVLQYDNKLVAFRVSVKI
jgi:hypothetical protein